MTEEENQALNALIPLIMDYRDDITVLNTLVFEGEKAFGTDWRTIIPHLLNDLKSDNKEQLKKNFKRAIDYENAVLSWTEANELLQSELTPADAEHLNARIPTLAHWLSMFGDAGSAVVDQLSAKLNTLLSKENIAERISAEVLNMNAPVEDLGNYAKDISWTYQYFLRLQRYYDNTVSRIGARCVQLGGIDMSQYPYYSYSLDVLDELISLGNKMLTDSSYEGIINEFYDGQKQGLQKQIKEYQDELQKNAPPEMLDDAISAEALKKSLGDIDNKEDKVPIGPAPDGFEPIPDLGDYIPSADVAVTPADVTAAGTVTPKIKNDKENTISIGTNVIDNVVKKVVFDENSTVVTEEKAN